MGDCSFLPEWYEVDRFDQSLNLGFGRILKAILVCNFKLKFWFLFKIYIHLNSITISQYSYDPKEHVAQMNIEGWKFQRIFKHIGQKCSKWTYRVLLSLRYWQVMFNKNPFLLLKWSKNSKIILNPVIIAVLKSLFPCFLI